jgi:hypothetical protein
MTMQHRQETNTEAIEPVKFAHFSKTCGIENVPHLIENRHTDSSIPVSNTPWANDSYRSIIPNVSTENSEIATSDSLTRKITIRDTSIQHVTVTYNLERERQRIRNLVANGHRFVLSRTDKSVE